MKKFLFICASVAMYPMAVLANDDMSSSDTVERLDLAMAPIRSQKQLIDHLAGNVESPMNSLSPLRRSHFISSLVFTSRGLGSYSYDDLSGLTVSQAYKILSLFGLQTTIASLPNLNTATRLDDDLLERARRDGRKDGQPVPFGDPKKNQICVLSPEGAPKCTDYYGHHCGESCS